MLMNISGKNFNQSNLPLIENKNIQIKLTF